MNPPPTCSAARPSMNAVLENRVSRHHARHLRSKGSFKRPDVEVERAVEPREAPVVVVPVEAIDRCAVADPVLHDGGDAVGAQARGAALEALDVGLNEHAHSLGIFAEGARDARPAGLGGQVGLRRQRHADPHGAILLLRDVRKAAHQCRVANGGQSQGLRPLRKPRGRDARALDVLEMASWVGADRQRDAKR